MEALPPGACDCHVHVFDRRWLLAGPMPDAPARRYHALQRALGLERVVLVQANGYGTDNRAMLDGLRELGPGRARGIAVTAPDVTERELKELAEAGVCGLRFHMLPGGHMRWEDLAPLAARIAPMGWHIQLQLDGRTLPEHAHRLQNLPCPLVIDHVGKFLEPVELSDPGFRLLCRLVEGGRCWVKLSAPYEVSRSGSPDYADVGKLAEALVRLAPERMLWASNWPHPWVTEVPDEQALLALLWKWAPEPAQRHMILVDNPAQIYAF
ncbi:MAG: amidohydrolase [Azospirillum brasilense]|nr:MAG: amidohydrolase [Azospirillum brasilense]